MSRDASYKPEGATIVTVPLDPALHKRLRIHAASEGRSIKSVVTQMIENRLAATPTPPTLSEDLREVLERVVRSDQVRDWREKCDNPTPCPWCQSEALQILHNENLIGMEAVSCRNCGARGPHVETARQATDGWNARAFTAPPARSYTDEDVARIINPNAGWDNPGQSWMSTARADALAKAAAIRLLSQGEKV